MKTLDHTDLESSLSASRTQLMCCASFEERSMRLPFVLVERNWDNVIVFQNTDVPREIDHAEKIISRVKNGVIKDISVASPTSTADVFCQVIKKYKISGWKLVIDFSTFTHEHLLILVKSLEYMEIDLCKVVWIYCRVKEYSINEENEKKWLSKGVRDIRSILGFSGEFSPELPTSLLILVGFESTRARSVIDAIEPQSLFLGKADSEHSESHEMAIVNEMFHNLVLEGYQNLSESNVESFTFSSNDASAVAKYISEYARKLKGKANLVIVPMNTKVSTLGVAWAFLQESSPHFQVVYAQAEVYNMDGYSEASDSCYLLENIFCK